MYSFKLTLDIFPSPIILVYAPTFEDCSKILRESYSLSIDFNDDARAITQLIDGHVVIFLPQDSHSEDETILVHETLHAAIAVLRRIGAEISYDNQEMMAYLQQHIYKRCKEFLDSVPQDDKS